MKKQKKVIGPNGDLIEDNEVITNKKINNKDSKDQDNNNDDILIFCE